MHPQCIGRAAYEAWWAADAKWAHLANWDAELATTREQWEAAARAVETAEVRRLRDTNEGLISGYALMGASLKKQDAEIAQLQTEKAELIKWGDGWQQQWTEMRDMMWKPAMDKLARVEDLADALDRIGNLTVVASIRKALGDPQPSAAPTPCEHTWISYSRPPMRAVTGRKCTKCALIEEKSKGEPYNGY